MKKTPNYIKKTLIEAKQELLKNQKLNETRELYVQKMKEIFQEEVIDLKDGIETKMSFTGTGDVQDQADKIILEMAKAGKNVNQAEYAYIQEIMKFMSPSEFQNFKNSISGMASQFNVQINSLNESKPEKLGKKYSINFIEYQFLSTFENLTLLKNKISETEFKVNIIEEVILRENPKSKKVLTNGKIGVYVFAGKEKLLKEKKNIIDQFKKEEENKENSK